MITDLAYAAHYRRWGFRAVEPHQAPSSVRWNYRMGSMARIISFAKGLPKKRLAILERKA
jgi:hypothetical protein